MRRERLTKLLKTVRMVWSRCLEALFKTTAIGPYGIGEILVDGANVDLTRSSGFRAINGILRVKNYLGVTVLVLCTLPKCNGEVFHATGDLMWRSFDADGKTRREEKSGFVVIVSNCVWQIKVVPGVSSGADYHIIAGNGKRVYYFSDMGSELKRKRVKGEPVGDNIAVGGVYPIATPHLPMCHEAGPLWLAFASGCYFESSRDGYVEPVGPLNVISGRHFHENQRALGKAHFDFLKQKKFVRSVKFVDNGLNKYFDPFGRLYSRGKMLAPFDSGFTNVEYSVSRTVIQAGVELPALSEFRVYWINNNNAQLYCINHYTIKVKNFSIGDFEINYPPRLPGQTTIMDERFIEDFGGIGKRVIYDAKTQFPNDEELKQSAAYLGADASQKPSGLPLEIRPEATHLLSKSAIKTLFLMFLILSFSLLCFSIYRGINKKTKG